MANEHLIVCGGATSNSIGEESASLFFDLRGRHKNVVLKIGDISRRMVQNIPDVLADLLEIASYVYCTDQAIPRNAASTRRYGKEFYRNLKFIIPVRSLQFWASENVREALEDTLGFLSDDQFSFEFHKYKNPPPVEEYLEFRAEDSVFKAQEVLLFSGGLDSLAGAVHEYVDNKNRIALVSHWAAPKVNSRQKELAGKLVEKYGRDSFFHIPVQVSNIDNPPKDNMQRTRSFLYAALGATVSAMFNLNRIRFYENGVVSFNLPISEQVVGARASRTTHPQVLKGFASLFTMLAKHDFQVENPFLWKSKADVFNLVGKAGCRDLIRATSSCTRTIASTTEHPHCGTCSQCIDRRFGALASDYADDDPAERYRIDLLTGARDEGTDRAMAESYVKTATDVLKIAENEFFCKYPEIGRTLSYLDGEADGNFTKILDLHKRHAREVANVVDDGVRKYATAIREGTLPDSCLLIIAMPEKYRTIPTRNGAALAKTARKRAERASTIDAVKELLRKHILAAKDHVKASMDHHQKLTLLPRPTQEQIAAELKTSVSAISRAINDPRDKEIKILWDIADDLEQTMRFKG
jgi:7-cyano-7-deazaguanine synthase in queuosine biosynthesis